MRSPTPVFIIASLAASLLSAASADAATGLSHFAAATSAAPSTTAATTSGTTTSGTTTSGTTTGTTSATTGTTTATTTTSTSIPSQLNKSLYPQGPSNAIATTPSNVTNNSGIGQTSTTFNNGAQYVVNADGTVQVLSGVPTTTTTGTTAAGTTTGNTLSAANGATNANGTFVNPVAADVFGTAPGQTSIGTLAGNSSAGIVDSGAIVANSNASVAGFAPGVVVGGIATTGIGAIDTGATQDAGYGVNANGERLASLGGVGSTGASTPTVATRTPTPTYDMVTRAAAAREANRRARGESPRVYGLAPRTENDRTDQMPDDPIIRY